ncbi:MAG: cytochrome c family protein [Parvibaculum sp.]|nr:cytochrome c family protein [Parvibaculum sp.]
MDSFEINKIAAAVLFSLLLVLGIKNAADMLYHTEAANPQSFVVEGVVAEGAVAEAGPVETAVPLPVLLASADAAEGAKQAKKCETCHNLQEGAGAKIGPDLYGIVGRKIASAPGFAYSAGMKAKGGEWTFEALSHFIENPKAYVAGTAMGFAGIKKPDQRAALLVYLNTLGSNQPLPKVEAAAPAAPAETPAGPTAKPH